MNNRTAVHSWMNRRFLGRMGRGVSGVSLLELLVVLVLLISVAVMVLPALTLQIAVTPDQTKSPQEVATMATLQSVREALVGQQGLLENLADKPSAVVVKPTELVREEPPEQLRQVAPELTRYQPGLGIGWRGPYVMPSGVNALGELTIVDGWGNEIAIHPEFAQSGDDGQSSLTGLHLISAGPNGLIEFSRLLPALGELAREAMDHDDVVVTVPILSEQP